VHSLPRSLRQVALATHVRPDLSYLFPFVIDGFIAYGVRAILLLRPLDARISAAILNWPGRIAVACSPA
jgi:hypothetical protein